MLGFERFKIQSCCFLRALVLFLVVMLLGVGCSHVNDGMVRGPKAVDSVMDKAESIMDVDARSADSLMNLIDSRSTRSKERLARYALLYTEAEYKNYQPVVSDSLIMIAVRHYSISNNINYQFLSNYYLGCVYIELGQMTDAAVALAQAEQLVDRIDNDFWKGLLYSQLGVIFNDAFDYYQAEKYYLKAESCFEHAGKDIYSLYALYHIGESKFNLHDFRTADSIIHIVMDKASLIGDSALYVNCVYNRMYCALYLKEADRVSAFYDNYFSKCEWPSQSPGYLELMALYSNAIGEYDKSGSSLKSAWDCNLSGADSIYLYYVSSLLSESKGQTEQSLEYFHNYTSLQNNNMRAVLRQPLLGAQKEHYKMIAENELLKSRHAKMTLILCVVIFMLIIVIVLVTYHYKKKRMKEQLFDSMALVEELTALNDKHKSTIKKLKNEVRAQFHERHDISNRLYSMYFDSESQDKVAKQQLKVTINSLIKDYTTPENVRNLDSFINETYDGIMDKLSDQEIGLTDKELQLFRYSFAGLSSKSVSVLIKESPQNIYQIKSRLLKKVKRNSEDLWSVLNSIW